MAVQGEGWQVGRKDITGIEGQRDSWQRGRQLRAGNTVLVPPLQQHSCAHLLAVLFQPVLQQLGLLLLQAGKERRVGPRARELPVQAGMFHRWEHWAQQQPAEQACGSPGCSSSHMCQVAPQALRVAGRCGGEGLRLQLSLDGGVLSAGGCKGARGEAAGAGRCEGSSRAAPQAGKG